MARFFHCTKETTIEETIDVFSQGVYRLHGLPRVLVSDKDPRFVSAFLHLLRRRRGSLTNLQVDIPKMVVYLNHTF
jgi:hypothetical protein